MYMKPTREFQPHEQRVVNERAELFDKITNLHMFFGTPTFESLEQEDQDLLEKQVQLMMDYSDVLLERINRFKQIFMENSRPMTYGEMAVGITFNPGGNSVVNDVNQKFADLIDVANDFRNEKNPSLSSEARRHASIAITEMESAQMRLVKALTFIY
jgi:hypothetical protein